MTQDDFQRRVFAILVACIAGAALISLGSYFVIKGAVKDAATKAAEQGAVLNSKRIVAEGEKRTRADLEAVCSRNNVFKANTRININQGHPEGVGRPENKVRNRKMLVLLNCVKTFAQDAQLCGTTGADPKNCAGGPVPLDRKQEKLYMEEVRKGLIPIMSVDGSRVIGSRRPETGGLADF